MSFTDPLNQYFKRITDVEGGASLLAGLANLGVLLPQGFEVLVGHVDIEGLVGSVNKNVLDDFNAPLKIKAGKKVLYSAAVFRQVSTAGTGTYTYGVSLTSGDAPSAAFLGTAVAGSAIVANKPLVADRLVDSGASEWFVTLTLDTGVAAEAADSVVDVFIVLV